MTLVCGIKLTHDGGLAVIDSSRGAPRLLASVEAEKWANGRRHAELADADLITAILSDLGLAPGDIGTFVLDGWGRQAATEGVRVRGSGGIQIVRTAPYRRSDDQAPPLHRYRPPTPLVLAGTEVRYVSYRHVEAHVASAYLTSAQARAGKPSLVLVWDGGVFPSSTWCSQSRAGCATSGISSGYLAAFTPGSAATWIRSGQTRTGLRISTAIFISPCRARPWPMRASGG